MDCKLAKACEGYRNYPQNLIGYDVLSHRLEMYFNQLKERAPRLFDGKQAAVDILDYNDTEREPQSLCVKTLDEIKKLLRQDYIDESDKPKCRYIFLHAPHSRAALRVSYDIFNFIASYYQVIPSFLDFLFAFGKQENAQDAHFSGFKQESHIERPGLKIDHLGRSGREIRLCYNLRSPEKLSKEPELPWSVRQTAIFHSFDLKTGHALWINIKGNRRFKNLTEASEASKTPESDDSCTVITTSKAFSATLKTNVMFCGWAGESWRWYINDLEAMLHATSIHTLSAAVDQRVPSKPENKDEIFSPIGAYTQPNTKSSQTNAAPGKYPFEYSPCEPSRGYQSRSSTLVNSPCVGDADQKYYLGWTRMTGTPTQFIKKFTGSLYRNQQTQTNRPGKEYDISGSTITANPEPEKACHKELPPELPPALEGGIGPLMLANHGKDGTNLLESFTFSHLQRIHFIEELTQKTLLDLKLNISVLFELRKYYRSLFENVEFPPELKVDCEKDVTYFERAILGLEKDLLVQQSRTETLLCLLSNRKKLLHDILRYRSVKASESSAERAQTSADKMEAMTNSMYEIARKTNQETVSMRVITSVTLFFLPGTFVATFMSTDILTFPVMGKEFRPNGLLVYLAISLPLMAMTFLAWFVAYKLAKRRDHGSRVTALEEKYAKVV